MSKRMRALAVAGAVGAFALLTTMIGLAVGDEPSTTCDGKGAIQGVGVEAVYGTVGDDYVVLGENIPFYGGGGVDTLCGPSGSVEAIVYNESGGDPPAEPHTVPDLTTLEEMEAGARR